jgi:hypothetical protein
MNKLVNRRSAGFGALMVAVCMVLLGGCPMAEEGEPGQPGGRGSVSAGKGLVRVAIGGERAARTLMPGTPTFIHYNLLFTPATGTAIKVSAAPEEYIDVELLAGTWRVEVYGYTEFDPTDSGTDTPYLAAYGAEASVTVANGGTIDVSVNITPIPVGGLSAITPVPSPAPAWWGNGAYAEWETLLTSPPTIENSKGIFSYWISYPKGLDDGDGIATGSATLTLRRVDTAATDIVETLPLTTGTGMVAGEWKYVSMNPGYYDMFITLKKKQPNLQAAVYTIAGVYSAVHIYAGMETKTPEYTFTEAADFVPTVNLAGTVTLGIPSNVTLSGLKVTAYMDAACTVPLTGGTALVDSDDNDDAEWSISTGINQGTTTLNKWLLTVPYYQTQYNNYTDTGVTPNKIYNGVYLKVTVTRSPHSNASPTPSWTTRETITRVPVSIAASDIPENGKSGIALTMNLAGVRVVFDDQPEDETWTLTGEADTLYWLDSTDADYTRGTPMTITVTSPTPDYDSYAWYLDDNNTDPIVTGINLNTIDVEAQDFWEGKHTLTCRVEKTTDAPVAGTPYSKTVEFTVARNR